ncbi:MAG TPA: phospholipase [Candidatus Micrarchaeia archaeon]|nr:phospholipase [Candidatus Micrarchaeia archaeon]
MDHPAIPTQPVGPVMIDIGATHGAVVVRAPGLAGREIEISPKETPQRRQHVAVLPRALPAGPVHAAVFASLPAGPYLLWDPAGGPPRPVLVRASTVTDLDW